MRARASIKYQPTRDFSPDISSLRPQIDIAPYIGASLEVMKRDADVMRDHGPTLFCAIKHGEGVEDVADLILSAWRVSGAHKVSERKD